MKFKAPMVEHKTKEAIMAKLFHSNDVVGIKTDFTPVNMGKAVKSEAMSAFLHRREARAARRARRAL